MGRLMNALILLGLIWLALWLVAKVVRAFQSSDPSQRSRPSSSPAGRTARTGDTFRPTPSNPSRRSTIVFSGSGTGNAGRSTPQNLSGLRDAFTGAPLDSALGLFQCRECQVFYHADSFRVLQEENAGRCVACASVSITSITQQRAQDRGGRNFDPDVVTLSTFREHVGRVATFEGYVHNVLVSRRGSDYAVMFENASWTRGFKLVFFRGAVSSVGGGAFIKGLKGKTISVRGLIVNHHRFGYEIIISERSMILSVRQ